MISDKVLGVDGKVERCKEMNHLKRHLIAKLFEDVKLKPDDNRWRKYDLEFMYDGKVFIFKCEYKLDNFFLSYRNFFVEHKAIEIDLHKMQSMGMLQ